MKLSAKKQIFGVNGEEESASDVHYEPFKGTCDTQSVYLLTLLTQHSTADTLSTRQVNDLAVFI